MPSYKFEVAKAVLNEADKNRILCLYLSSNQTSIDWQKAAQDFGSNSVDGFRRTTQIMLKKIKDAGGLEDEVPSPAGSKKQSNKKQKAPNDLGSEGGEKPESKPVRKVVKRAGGSVKDETPGSEDDDRIIFEE